jgi:hypothetical protein
MPGSHRRSVECEHAPALKDAIDDGMSQVLIVEYAPPSERLVGGEDHSPLLPVAIVDDMEEHVRGICPVREIADLVDHEHGWVQISCKGSGELAAAKAAESSSINSAAVTNSASTPFWIAR